MSGESLIHCSDLSFFLGHSSVGQCSGTRLRVVSDTAEAGRGSEGKISSVQASRIASHSEKTSLAYAGAIQGLVIIAYVYVVCFVFIQNSMQVDRYLYYPQRGNQ